jgi:hypothetical protein
MLFLCILLGGAALRTIAQEPAAPLPPELKVSMDQYAGGQKAIAAQREQQLATARTAYMAALEKLQTEATSRGELDAALAVRAERDRAAANKLNAEEAKTLSPTALAYRQRYGQTAAQISAQSKAQETGLLRNYLASLDELQKRITMRGDLAGALQVKQERTTAANRMAGLPPIPAAEPPRSTTPEPSTPVAPAPPPGNVVFAAQPVTIAAKLAAKAGATDPAPGVLVFDAPGGDGRRGAKGLLYKGDPGSLRNGSSWSFRYARGGSAQTIQIIHPSSRGQAIVHLGQKGVGLSTPTEWIEVGYGGGETKRVNEVKGFKEIFPLKDGQEYAVLSRLSVGGALELFIDEKLVVTGHVAGADPLSLKNPEGKTAPSGGRGPSEFKGPDLPQVWAAGWGGLIVGPMDSGENRCTEIRFYPGLADLGMGKR